MQTATSAFDPDQARQLDWGYADNCQFRTCEVTEITKDSFKMVDGKVAVSLKTTVGPVELRPSLANCLLMITGAVATMDANLHNVMDVIGMP
jgi:hypothetical protein